MSLFLNPNVLQNALKAQQEGTLTKFIDDAVTMGAYADATVANEAFNAAVLAQRAAVLAEKRSAATKVGQEILQGFSWPKSVASLLSKVGEAVSVPDADGNVPPWSVSLTFDPETGEQAASLVSGVTKQSRSSGNRSSGGKARLDGEILTSKLLREKYPTTVAGRIAENKMKPYGIINKANGEPYSENSQMNATQAVKADPELCERLTFDN